MLPSPVESEKLFSKHVPVTIKDGLVNQCRSSHLFVSVEWQEISAALHRKELLITLTDNDAPFFLYNLHLSEEDFQMLKNSQRLLVDFPAFPQKFVEFLELCLSEENKPQPKFLLVLNVEEKNGSLSSTAQLEVIETNLFKHLIHLSLKFMVATESSVKQYLAVCFRNLKEDKRSLQNRLCFQEKEFKDKLSDFKDKLSACQETLEKKSQELEAIRKELSVELSMKETKHARELLEERDRFLNKQREEESRIEKERREKEENFKKQIQQLEARVSCLDTLNKEFQDKNYKQDNTIRELRTRVLSLEEELRKAKESLRSCKEQNESSQAEIREKRLRLSHQKDKIDELEQEIHHKKQHINKMQEQLDMYHKQMKKMEKDFDEVQEQLRIKEKDVTKANYIIEKLQNEIRSGHEKLKSWSKLSSKHEYNLQERDRVIQILKKDLTDARIECKKTQSEIKTLTDTTASLREKISHMEKELKARENVNKFLNRQLTDRCIIPQYVPPPNLVSSHPSVEEVLKMNASGDQGMFRVNNAVTSANASRSKSPPLRSNNNSVNENGSSSKDKLQATGTTADSAYSTSPSCNTKSTNIIAGDQNANQTNLEIDSQALSAAFGSDRILKHSTAKKQTSLKSARNAKKS